MNEPQGIAGWLTRPFRTGDPVVPVVRLHGVITADNLTGSSAGSTSLLGANQVAALGAFVSGGDFAFNTIRTLTVNDAPSANGGAGDLTLTASGANSGSTR